jgi:hypothetical protein
MKAPTPSTTRPVLVWPALIVKLPVIVVMSPPWQAQHIVRCNLQRTGIRVTQVRGAASHFNVRW